MNPQNGAGRIEANQSGKKVYRWKNILRVLLIVLAVVLIVELFFYCATAIATSQKSFPIYIDTGAAKKGGKSYSISLSETLDFAEPTVHLKAATIDQMTNISEFDIPDDINDSGEGSHNGDSYIAYTFYLQNVGDDCVVEESMPILFSAKGADEAIRIRIYRNGVPTTYAKLAKDGIPEVGTTPFASDELVCFERTPVAAGEMIKYTIVVWLEGNDPECVNDIQGGSVRLSFGFAAQDE